MDQIFSIFPALLEISYEENLVFMKKNAAVGTGVNADALTFTKWSTSNPPTLNQALTEKILTNNIHSIHLVSAKDIVGYPGRLRYLKKNFKNYNLENSPTTIEFHKPEYKCSACNDFNRNKVIFNQRKCGHVVCIPCIIGISLKHSAFAPDDEDRFILCPVDGCNFRWNVNSDGSYEEQFTDKQWDDYWGWDSSSDETNKSSAITPEDDELNYNEEDHHDTSSSSAPCFFSSSKTVTAAEAAVGVKRNRIPSSKAQSARGDNNNTKSTKQTIQQQKQPTNTNKSRKKQ